MTQTIATTRQEPRSDSGGHPNHLAGTLTVDWFKQRTGYYMEPEMQRAGEKAEVLHLRAKSYCADAETGGYVPETVLPMLTPTGWRQRVAALVTVGLWDRVQGGYRIVDWDEDQAELEAYAARKRSDAARKRAQRERDRHASGPDQEGGQSTDPSTDASRDASRDGHVNVRTQEKRREERKKKTSSSSTARKRAAANDDPPPEPNPETAARDKLAREVLAWWWDQLTVKPAGKQAYHASLRVIGNLLAVGHEAKDVATAARSIGTPLTTARMEIELGKMRTAAAPSSSARRRATVDERAEQADQALADLKADLAAGASLFGRTLAAPPPPLALDMAGTFREIEP